MMIFMKRIFTVSKENAPALNRKARRFLAKKIRKDLAREQKAVKKDKANP